MWSHFRVTRRLVSDGVYVTLLVQIESTIPENANLGVFNVTCVKVSLPPPPLNLSPLPIVSPSPLPLLLPHPFMVPLLTMNR